MEAQKFKSIFLIIFSAFLGATSFAMDVKEEKIDLSAAREHKFPVLHWDATPLKSILKIAFPEEWRSASTYHAVKSEIEKAVLDNPNTTSQKSSARFKTLVLDPLFKNKFPLKEIQELSTTQESDLVLSNHVTFMKECRETWCPLTRSVTNNLRQIFEDDFVIRIMRQNPNKSIPLRYVGFGSGLSLLADLRVLLQLKKAGYKIEKVQIIDPGIISFIQFVQENVSSSGAHEYSLPQDAKTLKSYWKKNKNHFQQVMNTHLVAQFLAILSLYDGDEVVEYYSSLADYLSDNSNLIEGPHIIASYDLIDPRGLNNGVAEEAVKEFSTLVNKFPNAIFGKLMVDYLHKSPKSSFSVSQKIYKYTLSCATNECETCKKIAPQNFCSTCPVQSISYCSRQCQMSDWPNHKKTHQN